MRRSLPLAVSISGLLLSGCADAGKAVQVDPPTAGVGGSTRPAKSEGAFAKEGWFGPDGLHARISIKGVERRGAKSLLRYSVTSLDSSAKSVTFAINLLDPVGRRLYKPTGSTSGDGFAPGATREMAAEYPAIPQNVEKLTALTPGTAGEFPGIPVTGTGTATGSGAPTGPSAPTGPGAPGGAGAPTGPGVPTGAGAPTGPSASVDEGASTGTGAPTGPSASVDEGAPTGAGTPTGPGAGSGGSAAPPSSNPVVLYDVTDDGASSASPSASAGSPSADASAGGGATGVPADFRADDGKTVASRTAKFGKAKRRLDVKPFYRDGAYIVAVFDIVNEGPGPTPADASYTHKDHPGGVFTAFSVQIPGRKDVYRAVRIGQANATGPASYVGSTSAVYRRGVNEPVRGFVYIPAPPGNVSSVNFTGGSFGKVDDVPVK